MTERVDFYVLRGATQQQSRHYACRLAEKAYLRDLRVAILAANEADARSLDDLLWTFNDGSFVPHAIHSGRGAPAGATPPVYLTVAADGGPGADLLVNLSDRMPTEPLRFGRVAEIIDADDGRTRLGRERFKSYRELQLPIETHQIEPGAYL